MIQKNSILNIKAIIRNITFLVTLFIISFLSAQSATTNVGTGFEQRGLGIYTMTGNAANLKIEGSTYLFPSWTTSSVVSTKVGSEYRIANLNYDAKLDKFVAKVGKDSLFSFNPSTISQVVINNRIFKRYLDPELKRNSFYEVLYGNDGFELLKRHTVGIKEGYVNQMTKTKEKPDSYILEEAFFFNQDETLQKVSRKKKDFLKMFKEESKLIKEFIDENKLSTKKEVELKRIFTYYGSL